MARLGHYELCAAEGPIRAGEMFTSVAYQAGGWSHVRSRVAAANDRVRRAGGVLDFAVVKYPFGQGPSDASQFVAEPRFTDLLMMRDSGVCHNAIARFPMGGRYAMSSFARYCQTRSIKPFVYLGKAPDEDAVEELAEGDSDIEALSAWVNAMAGAGIEMIIDASAHDAHIDATRALIRLLWRTGLSRHVPVHFEAFPDGDPEPLSGNFSLSFGENEAWVASEMTRMSDHDAALLHTGSSAAPELLAAAAAENVWGVAANINGMPDDELARLIGAGRAGGGAAPKTEAAT